MRNSKEHVADAHAVRGESSASLIGSALTEGTSLARRWGCLLCALLLLCGLARGQGAGVTDFWHNGLCYTVLDARGRTLCLRYDRQRTDSLATLRSLKIPERIVWNSHEYIVRSLRGSNVFARGRGLKFDTIRIPITITEFGDRCLGGIGPVGLLELPEGFDVNLLSKYELLKGTYPRWLSIRGGLPAGFVWRRGCIYSADFEELHYYARQTADTVLYVPSHVRLMKRGALESLTARHVVLGKAMEWENWVTTDETALGAGRMTYYDPYQRAVGKRAKQLDQYSLRRPGLFCLPRDHVGRSSITPGRLVAVDKVPVQSSFTLHVQGKGRVWLSFAPGEPPREAEDGERFAVKFSTVVRFRIEPAEGQRAIAMVAHGDSIMDTEGTVPICFENESITAVFAGVDEPVNGVDYGLSMTGDTVRWLRFAELFTDLRQASHLQRASHYAAGRSPDAVRLEGLILPKGIRSIDPGAFDGYRNLRALAIPGGLARVDAGAFRGLNSLRELYIGGSPPVDIARLKTELAPLAHVGHPLSVYVDAEHLAAWASLSDVRHVHLLPVGSMVSVANLTADAGTLHVQWGTQDALLDGAKPRLEMPHLSLCTMDYRLPVGYDFQSIECNGDERTLQPVRGFALGDMRVRLMSKRVYCTIDAPHAEGGSIAFTRPDGKTLQPGDSVMRGEAVRVQALPGKYATFVSMAVNGHVTTTSDTLVTVLRVLRVSAAFRPQLCTIRLSDTAHFRWEIDPPIPPSGALPRGTKCRIAAVPSAGYELEHFAVNGKACPSPWHGELESNVRVEASVRPAGVHLTLGPSTQDRLSVMDTLGHRIAHDVRLPLNSVIRFRYAVKEPEMNAELYINGKRVHLPPDEWHQHTLREDCRFDVQYDTLWRYVSIDPKVGRLLEIEADRIVVVRPTRVGIPDGSQVTFSVMPEHAHRVRHLLIDDEVYAGTSVTFPIRRDVRFGAVLEQRMGRVIYTMKQPRGRIVVKDEAGRTVRPGVVKPRGFQLFITPLPAKGYVVGALRVNGITMAEPTASVEMGDSVRIECEFTEHPCVQHGDHCVDEARGVLVSSLFSGAELTLDDPAIQAIGPAAFAGNLSLQRVMLGESVERVETGAFHDCNNLRAVHLSGAVTSVAAEAFTGCEALHVLDIDRSSPAGLRMDAHALDVDAVRGSRLFAVRVPNGSRGAFTRSKSFRMYPVAERTVNYEVKCKGAEGVQLLVRTMSLEEGTVAERTYQAPASFQVEGGAVVHIEALRSESVRIERARFNGDSVALPMEQMAQSGGTLSLVLKAEPGEKGGKVRTDRSDVLTATVYPNPVAGLLHVATESGAHYEVYTLMGSTVLRGMLQGPVGRVDVRHLPSGTYLLRLTMDGRWCTVRFVKL